MTKIQTPKPNFALSYLSHITGGVREAALHQALDADLVNLRVSGFRASGVSGFRI